MSDYKSILELFVKKITDFTVEGVEDAFIVFERSLTEKVHAPRHDRLKTTEYIKTSLAEAAEAAKLPVFITTKKNAYGNEESTVYPGLIFVQKGDSWIAHAIQDGKELRPLDMNVALVCQSNGWQFDKNNLIGSATKISSDLKVDLHL